LFSTMPLGSLFRLHLALLFGGCSSVYYNVSDATTSGWYMLGRSVPMQLIHQSLQLAGQQVLRAWPFADELNRRVTGIARDGGPLDSRRPKRLPSLPVRPQTATAMSFCVA
jgi:hypothetical protein